MIQHQKFKQHKDALYIQHAHQTPGSMSTCRQMQSEEVNHAYTQKAHRTCKAPKSSSLNVLWRKRDTNSRNTKKISARLPKPMRVRTAETCEQNRIEKNVTSFHFTSTEIMYISVWPPKQVKWKWSEYYHTYVRTKNMQTDKHNGCQYKAHALFVEHTFTLTIFGQHHLHITTHILV